MKRVRVRSYSGSGGVSSAAAQRQKRNALAVIAAVLLLISAAIGVYVALSDLGSATPSGVTF